MEYHAGENGCYDRQEQLPLAHGQHDEDANGKHKIQNIPRDPCGRIVFFIVLQIQVPALGRVGLSCCPHPVVGLAHPTKFRQQAKAEQQYNDYEAYGDINRMYDDQIKADFAELYQLLNGMPLREMDWIINPVCALCRDHERNGFLHGVQLGAQVVQEIQSV